MPHSHLFELFQMSQCVYSPTTQQINCQSFLSALFQESRCMQPKQPKQNCHTLIYLICFKYHTACIRQQLNKFPQSFLFDLICFKNHNANCQTRLSDLFQRPHCMYSPTTQQISSPTAEQAATLLSIGFVLKVALRVCANNSASVHTLNSLPYLFQKLHRMPSQY